MDITSTLSLADLSETLAVCFTFGGAQTSDIGTTFKLASVMRAAKKLREEHFGPESPFEVARRVLVDKHTKTIEGNPEARDFKSFSDNEAFKKAERELLKQQVTATIPGLTREDLQKLKLFDNEDGKKVRVEITPMQLDAIVWLVQDGDSDVPKSRAKK